jgi:hypothetical protein
MAAFPRIRAPGAAVRELRTVPWSSPSQLCGSDAEEEELVSTQRPRRACRVVPGPGDGHLAGSGSIGFHDLDFGPGASDVPIEGDMFLVRSCAATGGVVLYAALLDEHVDAFKHIYYYMHMHGLMDHTRVKNSQIYSSAFFLYLCKRFFAVIKSFHFVFASVYPPRCVSGAVV